MLEIILEASVKRKMATMFHEQNSIRTYKKIKHIVLSAWYSGASGGGSRWRGTEIRRLRSSPFFLKIILTKIGNKQKKTSRK